MIKIAVALCLFASPAFAEEISQDTIVLLHDFTDRCKEARIAFENAKAKAAEIKIQQVHTEELMRTKAELNAARMEMDALKHQIDILKGDAPPDPIRPHHHPPMLPPK